MVTVHRLGGWLVACAFMVGSLQVAAQPERPWATGVAQADQDKALALYEDGNRDFMESRFAQALARYREAVQYWDHPAIRYNMVVCLINLDQPVEARADLERSLAYGEAPLGNTQYAQGQTYRKLLDAQLIYIEIQCTEPGAEVRLDGQPLLTGPSTSRQFLRPGSHQLVATKPGFLTTSRTFANAAGEHATIDIEPSHEPAIATRAVGRWAAWKPWAIAIGGVAVASIGGLFYWRASTNFARYDDGIAANCPHGCDATTLAGLNDLRMTKNAAVVDQTVAISLFAVGVTTVVAGVVGLVLNQPRLLVQPAPTIALVPGGATLSLAWGL